MTLPLILFLGGLLLVLWLILWTWQRRRLQHDTEPSAPPITGAGEVLTPVVTDEAVLIANSRGQLIDVNDTARVWLGVRDLDLDLEAFARRASPPDALLELIAAPGSAVFQFANRWVEGTSFRARGGSGQIVVILRDAAGTLLPMGGTASIGTTAAPVMDAPQPIDLSRALLINAEIAATINATLGVDQVLQTLLTIIRKGLAFDAGEINLYDPRTQTLAPRGWIGDVAYVLALAEAGGQYAPGAGITGWLTRYRKPLLITDSRAGDAVRPMLTSSPYRAYIGVPLLLNDRFLGTVELAALTPGQFSQPDLALLQATAGPMATTIYNAELYAQQSRRIQDLASLQQVTSAAPTDDLTAYSDAVYSALTQRVARLMDADICGVLLYDERKQALVAEQPFYGLAPFVARSYSIPAAPDTPGRSIWQADDVWLANDLADEPLAEALGLGLLINTTGVYNTLLLPLHAGTRRIGLLQVCNKHGRANFTQQDAQNLRLLGAQVAVVVEDIRLTRSEQRRETEMVGLQAITQAFGAIAHEDEFFASANERVAQLMGISVSGILLYDDAQQRLVAQLPFYGLPDEVAHQYAIDVPPGSVMRDLWESEDYWYTNNAPTDKYAINAGLAELASAIGIQKTLLAVLSSGGRRIGVIQVSNKTSGDDFTERDARLLLIFAAQIAAMIDNARLFRETQRRAEEAELLRSVAEEAGRILSSEDSFHPTMERIARLLRAEAVFINVLDRQSGNLVTLPRYSYGLTLTEPIIHNAYAKNFEYSVAIARRPFFSNDVPNDPRVLASYREAGVKLGIRKALLAPLTVGETSLGEIGVMNRPDDFSTDDLRLLNVIAIQIAAALDRIRLYEESGENLRRRLGELDAIQRVSNEVAQTLDIDRVLEVIRSEAIRATDSTISTIPLLLPPDDWRTPDQPLVARRLGDKRPLDGLAEIERAAIRQANTAVLVADYASSPLVPHQKTARSAVAVAFTHEDQPIGVIHLAHEQADHFDQRAAAFLETLAAKASLSYGSNLRFQDNLERSERLRRRVEQLNQIFELSQMLQASVDPVTMLEAIAYSVQQSCGFDTVVMTLADPDAGVLRRVAQAGMPVEMFELTKRDTMPLDVVRSLFAKDEFHLSESLLLPFEKIARWMTEGMEALATSFDVQRSLDAPSRRDDWRDGDMLLVPIPGSRGDFLGVMSLDRPFDGKRPDRQAVEVLEIFAHQAGSIIENTRTYAASQRQAEQEARLNELMEAIAATLDTDQIIESVARGALRVLPFTRMTLALLDADRRGFDLVYVEVQPDESLTTTRQHRTTLEQTALGRTFDEAADHLYYLTPETAGQYNDLSVNYADGERTSLIVPLITGGLVLGALHFGSDLINAFGFEEFRPLIKRIANLSAVAFGNANLFADAQTRTQRLALLNNVSIMLSQSLDTENIFETAVREIAVLLALPQAGGYIFDRGEAVNIARLIVEYPRGELPPETVIDLNSRAAFRKISHTPLPEPILVADVAALAPDDPIRHDMEAAGHVTYLLIPMVVGGQANGAIELLATDAPRAFDPEKLDLALVIASQAAIAVLNANLLEQTLVRTRELETLLEAAQATSTSLDLAEVFQSVSRLTIQALDMDECAVMMYDNVREELVVTLDLSRSGDEDRLLAAGTRFPLAEQPARSKALHTGQIQILRADQVGLDPRDAAELHTMGDAVRLYIPLLVGSQPIGLLQAATADPTRGFSHRETRMAQALGAQAATSIENARLTTETGAQVEQAMLINEISRQISSTMDIENMLRVIRDNVPRLTGAEEMYLALYDAASKMIGFPLAVRRGHEFVIPPRPLADDEVSFIVRHRSPLTIGGENPSADELRRNLGIRSGEGDAVQRYLGVPLIAGDQVLGVLAVRDQAESRPFGMNEQRIVQTIAAQLGAAVQNAMLFERVNNFVSELNERVRERTAELEDINQRVREEAEKNASILRGIADGVILMDGAGRVIVFNPAAERILAVRQSVIEGLPLTRLLATGSTATSAWVRPLLTWVTTPDRDADDELLIDRLEVGRRVISLRASSIAITAEDTGTVVLVRDITREVEVDRMKGDFIASVSHELRTPMTSIKGYADLLLMGGGGPVTDAQERFLQTIKVNADRLTDLVNDILNISRIDAGVGLVLGEVDLGAVLREVIATLTGRDKHARKQITLSSAIARDLPLIRADKAKIAQALSNIIDNAFNYTAAGGSVTVTADIPADQPDRVLITVTDTGVGIAEAFRERVWERFERDDDSALVMDVPGTGLGLNIVKTFVEMHGGRVWFDSTVNVGTTFYVSLPIAGPEGAFPLPADTLAGDGG